ncbi:MULTISPECIES: hypothetical protein [Chelativorans]|uniref:Sulfotransferase n=1 Tax=Chelativorans sp. (strain BNC1) TaxID=266779 RepID=Q11LS9_CHESB|nr:MULTISPECIES: hypothetical protein [Chelativorans]
MKVFGILGKSYSGSTVLNHVLNSAPGVVGASELWRLRKSAKYGCAICGGQCRVWTKPAREAISAASDGEFYWRVGDAAGTPLLVDASKSIMHFSRDVVSAARLAGVDFQFVLVAKNPLAHVASHLYNKSAVVDRRLGTYADVRAFLDTQEGSILAKAFLAQLRSYYRDALERPRPWLRDVPLIRIEDVVTNPVTITEPASLFFGIPRNNFAVDAWGDAEIHPIGGNSGPLVQTKAGGAFKSATDADRLDAYRAHSGLFIDEKWRQFMPERLVRDIIDDPLYDELVALLGYRRDYPLSSPSPV